MLRSIIVIRNYSWGHLIDQQQHSSLRYLVIMSSSVSPLCVCASGGQQEQEQQQQHKCGAKIRIRDLLLQKTGSIMESNIKNGILGTVSPSPYAIIDLVVAAVVGHDDESAYAAATSKMHFFKDLTVIDLGCGDARWLVQFALRSKGRAHCIGVEIVKSQIDRAKELVKASNAINIDLVMCDFFSINLAAANVLIVYLSREGNEKILAKIELECAVGTVVVAVGFQFIARQTACIYSSPSSHLKAFKYVVNNQKMLHLSI